VRRLKTLGRPGNFYECPRWHGGQWWVSDFYAHTVSTVDTDATTALVIEVPGQPGGLGWLPDGSLLVVAMRDRSVLRLHDGRLATHADLSELFPGFANDMTVTSRGYAYVGNFGFDLEDPAAATTPTVLAMVGPSGEARVVADDLHFPNASAITADGRTLVVNETLAARHTSFTINADGTLGDRQVWAQVEPAPTDPAAAFTDLKYAPDGGCLDSEDRMWVADALNGRVVLVARGGEILAEITLPDALHAFACALGGDDGRTLLIAAAPDFDPAARGARTESLLLTTHVTVPRIGFQD
jgi:sugar lactone lactonase YvrE